MLLIVTLCLLVSTLLITFASGLDKIRSNKILALFCPNLNLIKLFFDALLEFLFVWFVALRLKSTAMVIAGRSVHLTTLFPGQA